MSQCSCTAQDATAPATAGSVQPQTQEPAAPSQAEAKTETQPAQTTQAQPEQKAPETQATAAQTQAPQTQTSKSTPKDSSEYVKEAWALKGAGKFQEAYALIQECINVYGTKADELAATLRAFPPQDQRSNFAVMNDLAECIFIKGETLRDENKDDEAIAVMEELIQKYPYAQAFDPSRGVYWSIKETAQIVINQIIDKKKGCPVVDYTVEETKSLVLHDEGKFPVEYNKFGEFTNAGTKDYKYVVKDPIGLAEAVGEGIYPNTTSVKFDPEFVKIKKELGMVDHWKIFNSRDLKTAFYKWNNAPESQGVRQFYLADILERAGYIKQAIKAYYAVVVHFPQEYGWTYWHTPWYIGKASIYRIKYLLREHPELDLKLQDASIEIVNGFDNDVRNDIFVVNPGKLVKKSSLLDKVSFKKEKCRSGCDGKSKILATRGGDHVKLVKYECGDWQLLVDGKPFMLKAVTFAPTKIGESPDKGTMQNWTTQDSNANGIIDGPFEAYLDTDPEKKPIGDFQLMKQMGVNTVRIYHQPYKLNKEIIRQLYEKYGIYIILGDFLGKYALGSKADWNPGTIYTDPVHRQNMLDSVREMVTEFKDVPGILMWIVGNENVYGVACNADKDPESFFKFANEAALLIKSLDPQKRPVAIASGDTLFLDIFAKNAPDIDVYGANVYRGKYGFLDFWDEVKRVADRAAMITEYGAPSYGKGFSADEGEDAQAGYHKASWLDIARNACGQGAGNAVGGIVFEWLDEWWKAYEPACHDTKPLFSGPFLDGYMHEEWLGITGQGDGKDSPFLRHLKKAYFAYQELWKN